MKSEKIFYQKGSMLVGVLIVFLMISMVAIAIISRSLQGAVLTVDSKKGYATYQNSDSGAESFLDKFKQLDLGAYDNKLIPENTLASSFCGATMCYEKDGTTKLGTDKKVSDIFNFKTSASINNVTRTISAPVPDRVINGASISATACGSGNNSCSYNKCDILIKGTAPSDVSKISGFEARRSIGASLAHGVAPTGEDYGWRDIYDSSGAKDFIYLLKNGDENLLHGNDGSTSGGQYNQTYYFTIKAKHKDPFSLDSLYLDDGSGNAPKYVKIGSSSSCSGTGASGVEALKGLGCVTKDKQPVGTQTFDASYNCCNGTECYMPSPHWTNNTKYNCALEKCDNTNQDGYTDNVDNNPTGGMTGYWNGTSSPAGGYCGTKQDCVTSTDCTRPYRTVGYCTSTPSPISQNSSFLPSTQWNFSNYIDVNINNHLLGTTIQNTQPRCAKHLCPSSALTSLPTPFGGINPPNGCGDVTGGHGVFAVTNYQCQDYICGPYTASVTCSLSCNPGYYPAESRPGSSSNQVTVSYTNNCCYESQPGPAPSCASAGYGCGSSATWVAECGGGHWDYSGCWQPYGCGNDPVCTCGMTGSCTNTCSGAIDTRTCNPTKTCTGTREYPCVTGKDKKGNDIMGTCSELYTYTCC